MQKYPALLPLVWGSILVSTALTLCYTNLLVIQPASWYEPQYLNLGLCGECHEWSCDPGESLVSTFNASKLEIETHLSLGATPEQAVAQYRKDAIKAGLIPPKPDDR